MVSVVFDTNVYISAILTPGKAREALELARTGEISLLVSEAILWETERVLRLKIHRSGSEIAFVLQAIRDISIFISPTTKLSLIKEDDADNRVLDCALDGEAEYIVSGDQHHLLPRGGFTGIKALSPARFLELWPTLSEQG